MINGGVIEHRNVGRHLASSNKNPECEHEHEHEHEQHRSDDRNLGTHQNATGVPKRENARPYGRLKREKLESDPSVTR
jgi:hypothetical protein